MAELRFCHLAPVRFADLDVLGHVNHLGFLEYLEDARVNYYIQVMGIPAAHEVRFMLVDLRVRYVAPAVFGQTLRVGVRLSWLKRSSSGFSFQIRDHATQQLLVEGDGVQVYTDAATNRATPLPDEYRRRVIAFEGDAIELRNQAAPRG